MNLWQEYKRPASVAEAIHDLTSASGHALPIAGGTDLLLDLKQGRHAPIHTLVDLTFIPEMTALELRGDELYVGAAVPVSRVARDLLVGRHAQALVEACNLIAGPQVRNTATLGGNVAHAVLDVCHSHPSSSAPANPPSNKAKNSLLAFIYQLPVTTKPRVSNASCAHKVWRFPS
jgi:CO/xanthine dehydrogenase FAD-binding subunit